MVIADGLEDERLAWLARRLVFVERPAHLVPEHHAAMAGEIARRLMADAFDCGGWTTTTRATNELSNLLHDLDPHDIGHFQRLGTYLTEIASDADAVLTSMDLAHGR